MRTRRQKRRRNERETRQPSRTMPDRRAGVDLAVCHDPQKRLGKVTWAVVHVWCPNPPPFALALFWDKDEAVKFAELREDE